MIRYLITQTVRFECDCCGAPATKKYYAEPWEAKDAAIEQDFSVSEWEYYGSPRQTALCGKCTKRAKSNKHEVPA